MSVRFHAWWAKYGHRVVTCLGVVGLFGTAGLTGWGTYKSVKAVEEKTAELGRPLTKKEVFKECWKFYIPAAALGLSSGACVIGASESCAKLNASLAESYAASNAALIALKDTVQETVGEKKAAEIRREVIRDKMSSVPSPVSQTFVYTGRDKTLFFDVPSGRYFKSTIETVKRAELEIDRRLMDEPAVQQNDFYWEIPGLEPIPSGVNNGFICDGTHHTMDIEYDSMLLDDESDACITIDYNVYPINWKTINHG